MNNLEVKKKLLFVVNVDWFFITHRLPLALAAKKKGYSVGIASQDSGEKENIVTNGLNFHQIPFSRSGTNIFRELFTLFEIYKLYRKESPDIVHHITIKPIVYGSLISILFPKLQIINAVTGRGYLSSDVGYAKFLRIMIDSFSRIIFKRKNIKFIFQNAEDQSYYLDKGFIHKNQSFLIRGSGVNYDMYSPSEVEYDKKKTRVLLASRMIWDKGILEYVQAARILKRKYPEVKFILAGFIDIHNPNTVTKSELQKWHNEGIIEWIGFQSDMITLIRSVSIVVLPTYYPEGVPKILIEAASVGKPIITTNRPGCRDIVKDGVNGILIDAKNPNQLCDAIIELIEDKEKQINYGKAGREIVIKFFSEEFIIKQTLELYEHEDQPSIN